jgi:archaetidylinositol phosphate synthase
MSKAYDSRLARILVQPFADTSLHPNHLTTLSLLIGLAGAACFAFGSTASISLGAGLYMLSMFLDHTDGELARLSGKTSGIATTGRLIWL